MKAQLVGNAAPNACENNPVNADSNAFDLGHLLRLRETIRSAAGDGTADGIAAPGLTASYMRLRAEVVVLVADSPLAEEFSRTFPDVDIIEVKAGPAAAQRLALSAAHSAQEAQGLLRQLAGWIEGLVAEQTLQERIRAEAVERVRLDTKPATGFA